VVEGGREDGSEYAMEVGLRERHGDSAEAALRRDDTSLSSQRDSSLCRCWLRGRLGKVFAMDGLAALGCCFPAEMFHLSLCHLAKSSAAGKDSAVLPARCFSSGYRWRGIDYIFDPASRFVIYTKPALSVTVVD